MSSGWTVAIRALSSSSSGAVLGRRLDVRAARDLDPLGLVLGGRREDVHVVHVGLELGHLEQLGRVAVLARVADLAVEHRHRGHRRRAEVHRVVLGAAAAREVAVEGAQRVGVRRRRLAHAHARAADRLEHPHAALHQLAVDARLGDRHEDLARARRGGGGAALVHVAALLGREHRAGQREVEVGRVDRGADAHLLDRRAGHLLDRHDVVGVVRLGHQRPELAQVDLHARRRTRSRRRAPSPRSRPRAPGARATRGCSRPAGTPPRWRPARRSCWRSCRARARSGRRCPGR